MRLPCDLIRDLLPLYHDGICSEVSKTLVNEHLKECADCMRALEAIDAEIHVPKQEFDAAKPLKAIKRKWKKRTWLKGVCIGLAVFLLTVSIWFDLTQSSSVPLTAEEYTVGTVCRLSNGMYYLEFNYPYSAISDCADIHRSDDGSIHFIQYRPKLAKKLDADNCTTRSFLIDPEHNVMYSDTGNAVRLTAFYLGCPDAGDAVLLWSADMDVPPASREMEEKCLYKTVLR